jgi:hypothetical protein
MDETGMSDADKLEFVDDVLRTWGEEAAQEVAERYAVDLQALTRAWRIRQMSKRPPSRAIEPQRPPGRFFFG